jgi:ribonuclease Z
MIFKLKILGSSAGVPAYHRFTTAQILEVGANLYLIDAGEGVQMRLTEYGISKHRISVIFISHLHGDHYYGLIGLLCTMSMGGRTNSIQIFSPSGLEEIIELQLKASNSVLSFPVTYHIVDTNVSDTIYKDENITVRTLPLLHVIPTTGYVFREYDRPLNMDPQKIAEYNIPFQEIPSIKNGADYITSEGVRVSNHVLTIPSPKPRSYAFCSDTMYNEAIVPYITGVSMLYHEATFMHDMVENAKVGMHSTAREAAQIAQKANVERLVIGHISARFQDASCLVEESNQVFKNTFLGDDGFELEIPFR